MTTPHEDPRAVIEQLVGALENHAGNYKLNKAESEAHEAALTAGRAALAQMQGEAWNGSWNLTTQRSTSYGRA